MPKIEAKQNLTIQLTKETVRKAKVLAARRGTSVTRLVADTIEREVAREEVYEAAKHKALALLKRGFHLGGRRIARDELYNR
jgi:predicted transcriptional regulator